MIGSSTFIQALVSSLSNPDIENRLTLLKKTISAVEQQQIKNTARLSRSLIKVLSSVKKDPAATPDQLALVADFKARIGLFDPRNEENRSRETERRLTEREQYLQELEARVPKVVKQTDGFDNSFVSATDCIDRVRQKYGDTQPRWTEWDNDNLIRIALGDIPLNAKAVQQLWLTLSYDFAERQSLTTQTKWITSAICDYARRCDIPIPTPNCFNIMQELAFRA